MLDQQFIDKQVKGYLISYFQELIQSQNGLEEAKRVLLGMDGFCSKVIFNRISKGQESISIERFRMYLHGKVACNQRQLYSIFYRFDHLQEGRISYADFHQELSLQAKSQKKKKKKMNKDKELSMQVQRAFVQVIVLHMKAVRVLDIWRKQLVNVPVYLLFKHLDKKLGGNIGTSDLISFFSMNKEPLHKTKAQLLLKILKKNERELNLQAFSQSLNPLQFGYYKAYDYEFSKLKSLQILEKENTYREALEEQNNFFKERNKQKMASQIHREAALTRQQQLQERIAQEIKVYRDMKYQTRLKYNSDLTYEKFLLSQKQNIDKANNRIKEIEHQVEQKHIKYRKMMIKVDALREVQLFKLSKNGHQSFTTRIARDIDKENDQQNTTRELQGKIRTYRQQKLINDGKNTLLYKNLPFPRNPNIKPK